MVIVRASLVSLAFVLGIVGCSGAGGTSDPSTNGGTSGGSGSGSGSSTNGGSSSSSSAKFTCCLNDVYYVCPDKASTDKCATGGFDLSGCMANCAGNPTCMDKCSSQMNAAKPDPSACTKQAGQACPATDSPTNNGNSTATCSGTGGEACGYDSQCGAGRHCASGHCWDNATGSKCGYDSQCGSGNHCTDGCCQGNSTGTTCGYDSQCGDGNHCTNGKCYENASGSPCGYDSQCGAGGNCTGGKCQ